MATIATGPRPAGRSALLGQALGGGLGAGIQQGMQAEIDLRQAIEAFNPMREAITASLGNVQNHNPMQAMIAQAAQDPRQFARLMSDPQRVQAMMTVGQAAAPPQPKPEYRTVDGQVVRIDETGDARSVFNAREGAKRFTPQEILDDPTLPNTLANMEAIVQQRPDGIIEVTEVGNSSGDVRSRKIADYQREFSLSRREAICLVDGHCRIETDPQGGVVRFIDVPGSMAGSEAVRELPITPQDAVPEPAGPPPGKSLYELADVATGPLAAAREVAALGIGFMPEAIQRHLFPQQTLEARQIYATVTQDMIRGMAVNDKFPIGEMNRLIEEIRILPRFLDNPTAMRARQTGLDTALRKRLSDARRDSMDTMLSRELRVSQGNNARNIENFLRWLNVPQHWSPDSAEAVEQAHIETVRAFVSTASDEMLLSLPPDVFDAMMAKVKGN